MASSFSSLNKFALIEDGSEEQARTHLSTPLLNANPASGTPRPHQLVRNESNFLFEQAGGAASSSSSSHRVSVLPPSTGANHIIRSKYEEASSKLKGVDRGSRGGVIDLPTESLLGSYTGNGAVVLEGRNKLRGKDVVFKWSDDKLLQDILKKTRLSEAEKNRITNVKRLEGISRMRQCEVVRNEQLDIVDASSNVRAEEDIMKTARNLKEKFSNSSYQVLVAKLEDNVPLEPPPRMLTGTEVFVRAGQPVTSGRLEEEYELGFRVRRQERFSTKGALGFWRSKIPESLLSLVIPDMELYEALCRQKAESTIGNMNCQILLFLGWIIWKFFEYLYKYGEDGIDVARNLLPPWNARVLHIFGSDLLFPLEYALSTVKGAVGGVRMWWRTYPAKLVEVSTPHQIAFTEGQLDRATSRLTRAGIKHDVTKAHPITNIDEKWAFLSDEEKTILNLWAQSAVRWDTFSKVTHGCISITPAKLFSGIDLPEKRREFEARRYWEPINPNEIVSIFIEKEKIDTYESRFIGFECNCCKIGDINTWHPPVVISGGKYVVSEEKLQQTDTRFCLYHGNFGWKKLRDIKLPIKKGVAKKLTERLGATFHSMRRNAALWLANRILRLHATVCLGMLLRDIGWASERMLEVYAPYEEVVVFAGMRLYPMWGKLYVSRRLLSRYKISDVKGTKWDWSDEAMKEKGKLKAKKVEKKKEDRGVEKVKKSNDKVKPMSKEERVVQRVANKEAVWERQYRRGGARWRKVKLDSSDDEDLDDVIEYSEDSDSD